MLLNPCLDDKYIGVILNIISEMTFSKGVKDGGSSI